MTARTLMSYETISIRDALDKINKHVGGWYLPQVQRQYVWGARYESEEYICLLIDSIFRGYPIGGMVLWETDTPVPHHEFLRDYRVGATAKQVERGQWSRPKSLVYDGQQRLQTLHSVLRHTFNDRVLCFDTQFNAKDSESDETGFRFLARDSAVPVGWVKLNELCTQEDDPKAKERMKERLAAAVGVAGEAAILVKSNIDTLWSIFVETSKRPIAYFPVKSPSDNQVNEIFRRLNTGGIPLTQIELVLSKIKARYPDFEELLEKISADISDGTGGFEFQSSEILQFIHLLIFGTPRVDSDRVKESHVEEYKETLDEAAPAIKEFFEGYIWGLFRINSVSIVPSRLGLLPLLAYMTGLKSGSGINLRKLGAQSLNEMHRFFLLSQINSWTTQTMVSEFSKISYAAGKRGDAFPLDAAKGKVRNRPLELHEQNFLWQPWFSLKVLTPTRTYLFSGAKPQVDHIFPIHLDGVDSTY